MGRVDSTLKYLSREIMDTTDTLVQPLHELGLWYRALRTGWRYFSRKH
ncbi:PRC-barrel domain protein (fragment) [Acidithiobacillus ferrivorans]